MGHFWRIFVQTAYNSISLVPISSIGTINTIDISPSNSLPLVTPDRDNRQVRTGLPKLLSNEPNDTLRSHKWHQSRCPLITFPPVVLRLSRFRLASRKQGSLYQLNDSDQMDDMTPDMIIPAPRIATDDDLDGGNGNTAESQPP